MRLSVIVPTHNPHGGRLSRTLLGLRAQTLPPSAWETVLVDNASTDFPAADFFSDLAPPGFRIVHEPALGLAAARRSGLAASRGDLAVLVDDDNILAPDYLAHVVRLFDSHPQLGAAGGPSRPEFESEPPSWSPEFFPLLALRDLGAAPQLARGLRSSGASRNAYPACAPIGAGLALRRAAWTAWLEKSAGGPAISDRRGRDLTSGGDNDIVLALLAHDWEVGYFPELSLTHLIPDARLAPDYLARLNRGIQKSWVQVLARYDANPWPPIPRGTLALRQLKAWFVHRGWSQPSGFIRWQGICGRLEGLASL